MSNQSSLLTQRSLSPCNVSGCTTSCGNNSLKQIRIWWREIIFVPFAATSTLKEISSSTKISAIVACADNMMRSRRSNRLPEMLRLISSNNFTRRPLRCSCSVSVVRVTCVCSSALYRDSTGRSWSFFSKNNSSCRTRMRARSTHFKSLKYLTLSRTWRRRKSVPVCVLLWSVAGSNLAVFTRASSSEFSTVNVVMGLASLMGLRAGLKMCARVLMLSWVWSEFVDHCRASSGIRGCMVEGTHSCITSQLRHTIQ